MSAALPVSGVEEGLLEEVGQAFTLLGDFKGGAPYGSGHINATFAVNYEQAGRPLRYIFQQINTKVFKDPVALMQNISWVTEHQRRDLELRGLDWSRRCLQALPCRQGSKLYKDSLDGFWRVYLFIEGAQTYDVIASDQQAFEAAKAFGSFQTMMARYEGPRLHESILYFHHTPKRLERLKEAVAKNPQSRVSTCQEEIDFVLARASQGGRMIELLEFGKLKERITHNDTKLNNVMIDEESGEGVCVIDLDTVMPGLVGYDFGDMIRTATSPVKEDETDLSKVKLQWGRFEALAKGYLASAAEFLSPMERETLAFSGWLMSFEVGVRFLTDHLEGDQYFKIHRPGHNLDRCRAQFALCRELEKYREEMETFIASL